MAGISCFSVTCHSLDRRRACSFLPNTMQRNATLPAVGASGMHVYLRPTNRTTAKISSNYSMTGVGPQTNPHLRGCQVRLHHHEHQDLINRGSFFFAAEAHFSLPKPGQSQCGLRQVRPNPSLKRSANGMSRWPSSAGPAAHFALAVQRAMPLSPA